jgi:hypothetical protein
MVESARSESKAGVCQPTVTGEPNIADKNLLFLEDPGPP